MAMLKGVSFKQKSMTKIEARRSLTADDKAALPFLNKKCTDKNCPEFGMWQEDRLVKYIVARCQLADNERRTRVMRMSDIDVQMSGVIKRDDEELKRDRDNKRGRPPKATKVSLTLAYSQIDDCVTYLMSVFAPDTNMFIVTSSAEKQNVAEGLTKEVGRQGQILKYYREIAKMCLNALKYNLGGISVNWEEQQGIIFTPDGSASGQLKKTTGQLWAGNVLKSLDMYNFLYDTSVHPCDLSLRGEFYAEVVPVTPFRVRRMNEQKIIFGIERYINTFAPLSGQDSGTFYINPPVIREPTELRPSSGTTNWRQILAPGGPARDSQPGIEFVWFTCWIKPNEFSLSDNSNLELWRICMANGKYITSAVHIEDSHGQLTCALATPIEDDLNNDQRTYAEQLLPLQQFASFLMNTHIDATRKAIYGITVFDSNLFPGLDLNTEDLIGARIPMKSSATGIDIDKAFRHYNDAPQTDQNVDMIGKIVELMQKILPTNQAQQVADLERATEYQAAATVQAGSRRNLKIARLINDQCLSVVKFQMLYNIYAKMTVIEYVDQSGVVQQITPQQLVEAKIEFDVGTGLKGIDRLMQVSIFKDTMSYLFQTKDAQQEYDLLGLLSYVTQLAGFETDLSQFKKTPQQIQQSQQLQQQQQQGGTPNGTAAPAGSGSTTTA